MNSTGETQKGAENETLEAADRFRHYGTICGLVAIIATLIAAFAMNWILSLAVLTVWATILSVAAFECAKDEYKLTRRAKGQDESG